MSKRVRRLVSEVLSFLLVFSLIPTPALAEIVSEATGQDDVASGIVVSDDMTVTDNGDGTYTISSVSEDDGEAEVAVPETTEATEEVVQTEAAPAVEADDEPVAVAATPSDEPSGDVTDEEPVAEEVNEEDAIAKVGDTFYETLEEAFAAVEGRTATITLLNIASLEDNEDDVAAIIINNPSSKITLELDNNDVYVENSVAGFMILDGELTIKDSSDGVGVIDTATCAGDVSFIVNGGTLNIEGGWIYLDDSTGIIVNNGTLNVTGGEFASYGNCIVVNGGEATISGGAFVAEDSATAITQTGGKVTIGGDVQIVVADASQSGTGVSASGGELIITGGTFTSEAIDDGGNLLIIADGVSSSITGGTFNQDISSYLTDGVAQDNVTGVVSSIAQPVEDPVAKIGETEYATLADAFAAAEATGGDVTITMMSDADIDEQIVLDTDANITLVIDGEESGESGYNPFMIADWVGAFKISAGSLTIISNADDSNPDDDVIGGIYFLNCIEDDAAPIAFDVCGGTLNVGGTVTISDTSIVSATLIKASNGGTVNITSGEFQLNGNEDSQIIAVDGGTVSISGGTFEEDVSDYVAQGLVAEYDEDSRAWTVQPAAALTVTFKNWDEGVIGTLTVPDEDDEAYEDDLIGSDAYNAIVYNDPEAADDDDLKFDVPTWTGWVGSFSGTWATTNYYNADADSAYDHSSSGVVYELYPEDVTENVTLYPLFDLESTTTTWAVNDEAGLLSAVQKAQDGDAIKLYADVELTESVAVPDGVTLDLNGHSIAAAEGYVLNANDGVYQVTSAVASITTDGNTVYYATLADAVEAAADGDAVVLLADTTDHFSTDKSITLDLGGKKLTVDAAEGVQSTGGALNIANGTIASDKDDIISANGGTVVLGEGLAVNCTSSAVYAYNGGKVCVDGAVVTSTVTQYSAAFVTGATSSIEVKSGEFNGSMTVSSGTITVSGGKVSVSAGDRVTIATRNGGIVNVTGGTVYNKESSVIAGGTSSSDTGFVNISGGTITSDVADKTYAAVYVMGPQSKVTVTDGSINSGYEALQVSYGASAEIFGGTLDAPTALISGFNGGSATTTITGGTFDGSVYANGGSLAISGGKFKDATGNAEGITHADGKVLVQGADGYYTLQDAIAQVGNAYYVTIADALEAATPGTTIKLLKDAVLTEKLTVSKQVTIDLGGNKLTVNAAEGITSATGGDLTIVNGTIEGTADDIIAANGGQVTLGKDLTVNCTSSAIYAYNDGKVVVDGASVTGSKYTTAYATGTGSSIEVKSGTLNSTNLTTLCADAGATATISGGTVKTESENYCTAYSKGGGKITVTGGEVVAGGNSALVSTGNSSVEVKNGTVTAAKGYAVLAHEGNATATISGGTVNGYVGAGSTNNGTNNKLTITGGEINGAVYTDEAKGSAELSGGVYSVDPDDESKAPNATYPLAKYPVENGEGKYEIKYSVESPDVKVEFQAYTGSADRHYAYTGEAITPVVKVVIEKGADQPIKAAYIAPLESGTELELGADYTLTYNDNVNAGTAVITLTGAGDFGGTTTREFVIEQATIAGLTAADLTFNGDVQEPVLAVEPTGATYDVAVSPAEVKNVGTYTVTVTGKDNWTGEATATFQVKAASIADATIDPQNYTYTGKAIQPTDLVVKLGGTVLTYGTDYVLRFLDNTEVGTAIATIKGMGNYTGFGEGSFSIDAAVITKIDAIADQAYTGSAIEPTVVVRDQDGNIINPSEYVVTYENNTEAGTATVKVTQTAGNTNVTGEAEINFTITAAVAKIGDTYYGSLAEAIAAAESGDTVELLADVTENVRIPSGKSVTLDLNGNDITTAGNTISNAGALNITDSSETPGTIKSTGDVAIYSGSGSVLTVDKVNIESVEGAICTGRSTGASITVNGGTLSASDNAVIAGNGSAGFGGNTITVNGGTFNGGITSAGYVACGIYAPNNDTIVVNGGEFNITGGAGIVARAGSVTVNGGTINTTGTATGKVGDSRVVVPCSAIVFDSDAAYPGLTDASSIDIQGGTFKSEADTVATVGNVHRVGINGGAFSDASGNTCGTLPEGKVLVQDADNYYRLADQTFTVTFDADGGSEVQTQTVVYGQMASEPTTTKDGTIFFAWVDADGNTFDFDTPITSDVALKATWTQGVAKIGDVVYATLANAVASANDGDTITMIADEVLTAQVTIDKDVTIDLNGKTLSNETDIWSRQTASWSLVSVQGANVTIIGGGTIAAKADDCYAADVRGGGSLTIEDGTFVGNIHAVYVLEGELTVDGGDFSVQQKYNAATPDGFVINLYDANRAAGTAKATINGGTFHGFDPSDNVAEGAGTDFTPANLTGAPVDGQDGVWTVVPAIQVDKPVAATGLVFTGSEQTGVEAATGYTLNGNTGANAGSYTATATLEHGYVWSDGTADDVTVDWTIAKASISSATVVYADGTYDGTPKTITSITLGDYALVEGTDFDVMYFDNTNTGTATAVLVGKGNFEGYRTVNAQITPAGFAEVTSYTQTATIEGSGTANVVVTLTDMDLAFSTANPSIGRMVDGNWFGIDIVAPASVDEAYLASHQVSYTYLAGGDARSFNTNNDGTLKSGEFAGRYNMQGWSVLTDLTVQNYAQNYDMLQTGYKFDWDGDGVYEQTITIKFSIADIILRNADGEVSTQVEDGVIVYPHKLTKVEAVAPTFDATGNIEYYECAWCGDLFLDADGTQPTTIEDVTLPKLEAVAKIGDTYFGSLEEAVEAAKSGDTIELLADVTVSSQITITGKDIAITGEDKTITTTAYDVINPTGADTKLTLAEGITVTSVIGAQFYVQDGAELVIAGATITTDGGYVPVYGDGGSTITMTSGSVTSGQTSAIGVNTGSIAISGGTVNTVAASGTFATVYAIGSTSAVDITGGVIDGSHEALQISGGAKATISGDAVLNNWIGAGYSDNDGSSIAISGGTINGSVSAKTGSTIAITGGSFKDATGNKYDVPEGQYLALQDNGYYELVDYTVVQVPVAATGLVYNSSEQTGVEAGTGYTLTGDAAATKAGSYSAIATLDQYCVWSDGTSAAKTLDWTIAKADLSIADVDTIANVTYDGKEQEPAVTVAINGEAVASTEYVVTYDDNTNVGTAKVTVTAAEDGNYTGEAGTEFTIVANSANVTVDDVADRPYTGSAIEPELTVTDSAGNVLAKGTDYDVTFSNNTNVGAASFVVQLKGNHSGSYIGSFNITSTEWTLELPYTAGTLTDDGATFENLTLTFSPANPSIGRMQDGYWVGFKFNAPASLTDANLAKATYSNNGGATWKNFASAKDGKNADGTFYMQAWVPLTEDSVRAFIDAEQPMVWTYKFAWDGDQDNAQTFVITVSPENVTLVKDGEPTITVVDWLEQFEVTFVNGDDVTTRTVSDGDFLDEPVLDVVDGKTLVGWFYADEDGDEWAWDFEFDYVESDLTLTAKWANTEWTLELPYTEGTLTEAGATFAPTSLSFSPADASVGRMIDGYWVGFKFDAPDAVTADTISATTYSNDGGATWKSFANAKDGQNADGTYFMQAWVPLTEASVRAFVNAGQAMTWTYKFAWDGGQDNAQTFMITVDPSNVTLVKDGAETIVAKDGVIVFPHALEKVERVEPTFEADGNIEYYKCTDNGCEKLFSDAEGTQEITEAETVIPRLEAVAKIGDVLYASLADAVAAANDGDTVELLVDVTEPGMAIATAITLDLGGNEWTVTDSVINATADATITNGSITSDVTDVITATGAKLTLDGVTAIGTSSVLYATNGATINVNGSDVAGSTYTTAYADNGSEIVVNEGSSVTSDNLNAMSASAATLTINGGTVASTCQYPAVYVKNGGEIVVNGGTVTSDGWMSIGAPAGTLTINGGTMNKAVGAYESSSSKLVVNGGTMGTASGWGVYVANGASAEVNGGTIYGNVAKSGEGTIAISDGWFSKKADTFGDFVVDGKYATDEQADAPTADAPFTVAQILELASVTADDQAYTGTAIEPEVTVTDVNGNVVDAENYDVTFEDNLNVGTATITVTAKDGSTYTGTVTGSFQIVQADISEAAISDIDDQDYTGSAIDAAFDVFFNGVKLVKGTDYDAYYSNNVDPGTANIVVVGKGNFTNALTKTFTIKSVDKSELKDALDDAADALDGVTTSDDGSDLPAGTEYYPTKAVEALNAAIAEAQAVYDDDKATQAEVDAATEALNKAIEEFEASKEVAEVDTSALEAAIAAAKADETATTVSEDGTDLSDGTKYVSPEDAAKLAAAIEAAQAVLDDPTSSQDVIDAAAEALNDAIAAFDEAKKVAEVDKSELEAAVEAAKADEDETAVSEDGADLSDGTEYVNAETKKALDDAIAAAKAVLDDPEATQAEVDAAVAAIEAAKKAFDDAKNSAEVDKDALNKAIADAIDAADVAVSEDGTDLLPGTEYASEAAKKAIDDAIEAAKAVADDPEATQAEVDAATKALTDALEAFKTDEATIDTTALEGAIDQATRDRNDTLTAEDASQVDDGELFATQADKDALTEAIGVAKATLKAAQADPATATQDDVDAAVEALNAAKKAFDDARQKGTKTDKSALEEAIKAAEDDAKATPTSEDGYDLDGGAEYATPEEAQKLADAINAAKEVLADENATQAQIDEATQAIKDAKDAFDAAKKTADVDKTALENALSAAAGDKAGTKTSKDGTDLNKGDKYVTSAEAKTLQDAIDAAKKTASDPKASQAQVDAATKAISSAQSQFDAAKKTAPGKPGSSKTEDKVVPMYRLYNPNSGEHFYTASKGERNALVGYGWNYEGIGWWAPKTSNTPVYRLYNENAGDHHYTTSIGERDALVGYGWKDEGIGWYSDDAKTIALYREYNPYAVSGSHNYTTSKGEHNYLCSVGWQNEDIGWYGVNPSDYGINPNDSKWQ